MSDQDIEQEIQSKGKTAARVTPEDIEANISSEFYFTAHNGIEGAAAASGGYAEADCIRHDDNVAEAHTRLLTFCVLVLRNGTRVVGVNYGSIDPAQHSAEDGKKYARAEAIEQIWPLMGYELRSKLAADGLRAAQQAGRAFLI